MDVMHLRYARSLMRGHRRRSIPDPTRRIVTHMAQTRICSNLNLTQFMRAEVSFAPRNDGTGVADGQEVG